MVFDGFFPKVSVKFHRGVFDSDRSTHGGFPIGAQGCPLSYTFFPPFAQYLCSASPTFCDIEQFIFVPPPTHSSGLVRCACKLFVICGKQQDVCLVPPNAAPPRYADTFFLGKSPTRNPPPHSRKSNFYDFPFKAADLRQRLAGSWFSHPGKSLSTPVSPHCFGFSLIQRLGLNAPPRLVPGKGLGFNPNVVGKTPTFP